MALAQTSAGSPQIFTTGTIELTADLNGSNDAYSPELTPTGVLPGTYITPSMVVDVKGRVLYLKGGLTLPCATAISCGGVKAGNNITYQEVGSPAIPELSVEIGSETVKGIVQAGTGFTTDGCCLRLDYPIADEGIGSPVQPGLVIVSGDGLSVDVNGALSADLTSEAQIGIMQVGNGMDVTAGVVSIDLTEVTYPLATEAVHGIMQVGNGLDVDGSGVITIDYTEQPYQDATESSKGIMQVGNGLDVTAGVVSVDLTEVAYQDATVAQKGIVQIGSNINVSSGTISLSIGSNVTKGLVEIDPSLNVSAGVMSLPIASDGSPPLLGGIKIGSNINIEGDGTISVGDIASYTTKGTLEVTENTGLTLSSGVLSGTDATESVKGVVQVGTNIDVNLGGDISILDANTVEKGVMKVPNGDGLDITGGTLSFIYDAATDTTLGGVKIPTASSITNTAGAIDVQDATGAQKGVVQIGTNIDISSNIISVATADTSGSPDTLGLVKSGDTNNITITSGDIDVGTNIPKIGSANTFTKAQVSSLVSPSYTATWTPDFSTSNTIKMDLTGNITINQPTNLVAGCKVNMIITQDATGGRTATWNSAFKFKGSSVLTTTANAIDVVNMTVIDSSTILCQLQKDFS